MFAYSFRKPEVNGVSEPDSPHAVASDPNMAEHQLKTNKAIPSFLDRMSRQKQFEDGAETTRGTGSARPTAVLDHHMTELEARLPARHIQHDNTAANNGTFTSQPHYYSWRAPAPSGPRTLKDPRVTLQQPTASNTARGSGGTTGLARRSLEGVDGAEVRSQPRRLFQESLSRRGQRNSSGEAEARINAHHRDRGMSRHDGVFSNYELVAGAAPLGVSSKESVPRRMPSMENIILEQIKDYYCAEGENLHAKVTNSLTGHHDDLASRLNQLSVVDDKFLRRLKGLEATLSQPFAETRTYKEGDESSSVTISEAVETLRGNSTELQKWLKDKWKTWDTAKAAEDEAFARILKHAEEPDPGGRHEAESRRIKWEAKKQDDKMLEELNKIEREFEKGKAELDQEISRRFWG